jgi:hypothetical protein
VDGSTSLMIGKHAGYVTSMEFRVQGVGCRVYDLGCRVLGLTKQQRGLQHEPDDGQTRRVCHKPGIPGTQTTWSNSA